MIEALADCLAGLGAALEVEGVADVVGGVTVVAAADRDLAAVFLGQSLAK